MRKPTPSREHTALASCHSGRSEESAVSRPPAVALLIRNAHIITLDDANHIIASGSVEVLSDGTIGRVERESSVVRAPSPACASLSFDAQGKLLMPALINCHTHLYSALARGLALRGSAPRNFPEILRKLWWKLDAALREEDVYYSALVGLMDSAKAGVGTLLDHHSSPAACPGSLDIIERAFREVGLRGALCYETSDRNGASSTAEAIAENVRFIERTHAPTIGAAFGLHASFTLSDRTLRRCVERNAARAAFHVHVAEAASDVKHARARFGKTPVERLCALGILDHRALAAHCVHVSPADVSLLAQQNVNVVHNPQSNCNNAVGMANLPELLRRGVLVGLGSDGFSPRLWDEFVAASHVQKLRARDPRVGMAEAYTAALLNNRALAKKNWNWDLGRIARGASADLALFDYYPPTPLTAENLLGHLMFGVAHAPVDALLVNGKFVVRGGQCVNLDERAVSDAATLRARRLWRRL